MPFLNWRYILFNWNDSDEEMALARRLAAEIGVDRLSWEITDHPENAYSRRFVPGTPALEAIGSRSGTTTTSGNAIPGATPRAAHRRPHAPAGAAARRAARAGRCRCAPASGTCPRARFPAQASYGRRLVRLGAQLCAADGTLIDRDFARAWLPHTVGPGGGPTCAIEIPAPEAPGRYSVKFDLVSEGIDWFERCGSPTTTRRCG